MAFDAKFLETTLAGEGEAAAKIQAIMAEYEADVKGIKLNRDKFRGDWEAEVAKASERDKKAQEYEATIKDLSEKVKKAGSEETKKYYEDQLAQAKAGYATELQKLTSERDDASKKYGALLGLSEFEKALAGDDKNSPLQVRPELRGALRDLFYTRTPFERKMIDGQELYLSNENKSVRDALSAYLQTPEGKYFVAETNSGGGAGGSTRIADGQKTMKRTDFDKLSPAAKSKAMKDGIALVD